MAPPSLLRFAPRRAWQTSANTSAAKPKSAAAACPWRGYPLSPGTSVALYGCRLASRLALAVHWRPGHRGSTSSWRRQFEQPVSHRRGSRPFPRIKFRGAWSASTTTGSRRFLRASPAAFGRAGRHGSRGRPKAGPSGAPLIRSWRMRRGVRRGQWTAGLRGEGSRAACVARAQEAAGRSLRTGRLGPRSEPPTAGSLWQPKQECTVVSCPAVAHQRIKTCAQRARRTNGVMGPGRDASIIGSPHRARPGEAGVFDFDPAPGGVMNVGRSVW
jgi:hypothetical protein